MIEGESGNLAHIDTVGKKMAAKNAASNFVAVPEAIKVMLATPEVAAALEAGMEFASVVKLKEGETLKGRYIGTRADKMVDQNTEEQKDVTYHRFEVQPGLIAEVLSSSQLDRHPWKEGIIYMLMRGAQVKSRQGNQVNTFFIGEARN